MVAAGPLLVLAPLPEEIRALRQRLTRIEPRRVPGLPLALDGDFEGSRLRLAVTGDGERNARRGIEAALAAFRPSRLLVIGVAGALTPDLGAGEVIAARQVLQLDADPHEPSPELLAHAVAQGIPAGTVVTTPFLASTPEAKARLAAEPGVGTPAVVDLESAVYAEAADAARVPWLVLRAVSDTVTETLPGYLERCRDAGGAVRRGRVALHAVMRPWTIPALVRLARNVDRAAEVLAERVAALLHPGPVEHPSARPARPRP